MKKIFNLFLLVFSFITLCEGADMGDLREKTVETQIVARGVKDEKVLDVMRKVERHLFVPKNVVSLAYNDYECRIIDLEIYG